MVAGATVAGAISAAAVVLGAVVALESLHDGFAKARADVRPSTAVAVKPVVRIRADEAACLDFLRGV